MRRLLLIIAIAMCASVQMNAAVKATNGAEMRASYNEVHIAGTDNKVQNAHIGGFVKNDYLICIVLVGAYVLMRKKKSRKVDL